MNTVIAAIADGAGLHDAGPHDAALPAEWAAWAEEPGRAVRVEEAGALLGVVHVVIVGRDEAWLEGLWVSPSARGRGVGRALIGEAETLARGHGAAVARTAVPGHDYGALAVAERTGFVRHSEAVVLTAEIPSGPLDVPYDALPVPAGVKDTARITAALETAPQIAAWHGLFPLGWRFRRLVQDLVRGVIKDGRVLGTDGGSGGVAVFVVRNRDAVISVLTGEPAQRAALFGDVLGRARMGGARRVALFAPDAHDAADLRTPLAPHPWCPDGLVIVEKPLAR
jgi:GNAT superfamily N-acetyltransferase